LVTGPTDRWNQRGLVDAREIWPNTPLPNLAAETRTFGSSVIKFLTLVGDGKALTPWEIQAMAETLDLEDRERNQTRRRERPRAFANPATTYNAPEPSVGKIQLQQLFEHSPVPTIVVDRDLR